jgi:rubrerythrin
MIMSTGLLQYPPEIPAVSIEEIMATAHALEDAAVQRYRKLAAAMRAVAHEDVAQVFDDLTAEEEQHVLSVEKMTRSLLQDAPAASAVRWVLPETFGAEEAGPPALLTPYKALSIAVRTEERAFAFWSYVAASAAVDTVRALAETMARQELLHASKLRVARRRAYHAQVGRKARQGSGAPPLDLAELRYESVRMATEATAFLSAAATRLDQLSDRESAILLRDIADAVTASARLPAANLDADARRLAAERLQHASGSTVLFEAEGVLERWLERYVNMLDRSPDALVTAELQRLADETVRFVAQVSRRLAALEPGVGGAAPAAPRPALR